MTIFRFVYFQEIRDAGGAGYDFITVEEDEAANVLFVNNTVVHLANEQIPRGAMVSTCMCVCVFVVHLANEQIPRGAMVSIYCVAVQSCCRCLWICAGH